MEIPTSKKSLTEEDIKLRFITPAITGKWDKDTQIRMEYNFTDGRVIVRGNVTSRGKRKKADYILYYKRNMPLAIVEAKDNNHSVRDGIQQGIEYAAILDVPFVYSSNGDAFFEHDMHNGTERELKLEEFPTPDELWDRYKNIRNITLQEEKIITEPYFFQHGDKIPRYYQRIAINRTVEYVAKGQKRILLAMATGTGKTYTAFQIIHRLWKSGLKKKILYLADRNILIDQAMRQDFKPFGRAMTKVQGKILDSAYEIYLSLYHQLAGEENEEPFREFKPNFFDLIVIDECHRGSAKEESRWRKILEYFSEATHIGMTATPKETKEVSNQEYFGKPLYIYNLKQGIDDGFLAPYKVVRVGLNKDLEGYRPEKGKLDKSGNLVEDREYNITDFDRNLVIDERTEAVAARITEFLKANDRFAKTIVFCIDTEHAARMRSALVNENVDLVKAENRYVMKITYDDAAGKAELENFIAEDSAYPVIVTTSELLSTGVDCKTCKLIVLDKDISSDIEFKQIIGRGTRLVPRFGKEYFTIMDFRGATRLFANDDFWEVPEQDDEFEPGKPFPPVFPEPGDGSDDDENGSEDEGGRKEKIYINGVLVTILSERVQYYDKGGKLITESLTDYTKKSIRGEYSRLDDFLKAWNGQRRKQAIIDELQEHGVLLDALREASGGKDIDEFDLICHVAFDKKPLTRAERANNVKKRDYLNKYEGLARDVLSALLDKYAELGIGELADTKVLSIEPFLSMGGDLKIARAFGGRDKFLQALDELQYELYAA
jgi:type I restriction enzyme R subunit